LQRDSAWISAFQVSDRAISLFRGTRNVKALSPSLEKESLTRETKVARTIEEIIFIEVEDC